MCMLTWMWIPLKEICLICHSVSLLPSMCKATCKAKLNRQQKLPFDFESMCFWLDLRSASICVCIFARHARNRLLPSKRKVWNVLSDRLQPRTSKQCWAVRYWIYTLIWLGCKNGWKSQKLTHFVIYWGREVWVMNSRRIFACKPQCCTHTPVHLSISSYTTLKKNGNLTHLKMENLNTTNIQSDTSESQVWSAHQV